MTSEERKTSEPVPGGAGQVPASEALSDAHNDSVIQQSGEDGNSCQSARVREGSQPAEGPGSSTAKIDGFIKPANDDMNYKQLVLPNGIRVLLVSDPTTDKAGAAMDVRVGSVSDPDELPGLAHFTEHMLFYSSEKYPEEDEYTKFISDRGGRTNAYTAADHTNYHFEINWESLGPALDRFAQFFIAPTISPDGIEREVKAVDSEHGKNLLSDAWRKSQVNKATANPNHPWARFSTGNQETLYTKPLAAGTDPRDAVVEFYNRHYSADRCALAVMGRQPLEELEDMVRSMFSPVPNKQLPRPAFGEDVFRDDQMGVLIRLVPVREGQSLELMWQMPPTEHLFREAPLGYLSHLLGHEGEGSVFALLKAAGWASSLWAGESGASMSFTSFFTIHVDLTEEGQRRIKDVVATVFRYLALLRRPGGICQRIWEEVRGLAQLQFDTRDRSQPLTYCTALSNGLQLYPPQELLPAVYGLPLEFSPSSIREALELLTPQRVRALWVSKAHLPPADNDKDKDRSEKTEVAAAAVAEKTEAAAAVAAAAVEAAGDAVPAPAAPAAPTGQAGGEELLTEPVYGTRYGISPLPADWLEAWVAAQPEDEPRLHLPAPNRFIPTDLSLADDEAAEAPPEPVVALAIPGHIRLWHKPETRFRQPKAVLYLDVHSPEAYTSPRAAVMTRMFTKLLLDYLNEMAYPAQQTGLDYNVLNTQSGWQLLLSGYNHKMPELLREVLNRLAEFKVLPDRFEFVREGLVREYANQLHNQPYSWAMYRAEMLTTARRWPIEVYGSQAASVTADELQDFVRRLCSRCFVEGLAAGNLRRQEVLRCGALLLSCLRDRCGAAPLHPAEMSELRMLEIPPTPTPSASPTPPPPKGQQQQQSTVEVVVKREQGPSASAPETAELQEAEATAAADAVAGEVSPGRSGDSGGGGSGVSEIGGADGGGGPGAGTVMGGGDSCGDSGSSRGGGAVGLQPVSGGWLFTEDVPSGQDENSAAVVMYQVGPDDLRLNALRSLLVHMAKRDAFAELRTRQQLGYIVSLHGGSEHGVGYMEMLVQSNAYDASELCQRLDDFMNNFLESGLPAKCGLTSASEMQTTNSQVSAAPSGITGRQPQLGQDSASRVASNLSVGGEGCDPPAQGAVMPAACQPPTEFEVAVEELAKSKLEKPKKLGDLANRWWSEIHHGCYCFNRQEAEVAHLRTVSPEEVLNFAWELLTGVMTPTTNTTTSAVLGCDAVHACRGTSNQAPSAVGAALGAMTHHCRKLSVQIRGKGESDRAARHLQQQQQKQNAAAVGHSSNGPGAAGLGASLTNGLSNDSGMQTAHQSSPSHRRPYFLIPTDDPFSWKRSCCTMPAVRALWAARRIASGGQAFMSVSVSQEEVEGMLQEC